jgi:uncharacterized membrane protein YhaH (DUF805 family)
MILYGWVVENYAVFSGGARGSEFWDFNLFNVLIQLGLGLFDYFLGMRLLEGLYGLAILIPSIAVTTRRLHDTDRSGWWQLLLLIPLIGWIVLIVFEFQDSQPSPNRYGPNPKAASA